MFTRKLMIQSYRDLFFRIRIGRSIHKFNFEYKYFQTDGRILQNLLPALII